MRHSEHESPSTPQSSTRWLAATRAAHTRSADTSSVEDVATPQLTFDGTVCTYAGPTEVTQGVVVVEFVNTSDGGANIEVDRFDDEGYTGLTVLAG